MALLPNELILEIYEHIEFEEIFKHLEVFDVLNCVTNKKYNKEIHTWNWAAKNGHLEVVKWLHENRKEGSTTKAMDFAAEYGHLEILKFLHENRKEGCTERAI